MNGAELTCAKVGGRGTRIVLGAIVEESHDWILYKFGVLGIKCTLKL